ncbi:hypothetical protein H0H87_010603 [Tephrocybe sp. NHM501043]|nr:hypothetical protein H0H87_010603 [Tephrocybe sp. NHM501043]
MWTFDFLVYEKGGKKPITSSSATLRYPRSVNTEVALPAGEYVVHVRLDRFIHGEETYLGLEGRTWLRVMTEKIKSQAIASSDEEIEKLPVPLDVLAGHDLAELEIKVAELPKAKEQKAQGLKTQTNKQIDASPFDSFSETANPSSAFGPHAHMTAAESGINTDLKGAEPKDDVQFVEVEGNAASFLSNEKRGEFTFMFKVPGDEDEDDEDDEEGKDEEGKYDHVDKEDNDANDWGADEETDVVYLGLRVYTNKAVATVGGQLRHTSLTGLAASLGKSEQVAEPL